MKWLGLVISCLLALLLYFGAWSYRIVSRKYYYWLPAYVTWVLTPSEAAAGPVHVFFLCTEEIDWVEAAGNYVRLHARSESHLLRESMKNMEARLDPNTFVRIHRSAIVNIDRVKELEPWFHGEYIVIMRDGTRLTASRVYSDRLSALIE